MSIKYTYEIISVDAVARCMEVVYSSEGRTPMHIGARLPFEGESLESVIDMFSPVEHWRAQDMAVVIPQVGLTGTISEAPKQQSAQDYVPPSEDAPIYIPLRSL